MYLSDKPRPIPMDFYKQVPLVDVASSAIAHHQQQQPVIVGESSSGGEEQEMKAPKKRAETWVQEETRCLIGFRRQVDSFFNTSKSNRHLWDQISAQMRDKGFDRSPTMCTDKWRNLLKEFKKVKHQFKASAKISYYKELEDLLRDRPKHGSFKATTKVDSSIQFSHKGLEDANIPFGAGEANGNPTVNLERPLDTDGGPLTINAADAVVASEVPPWNWRETPGHGADGQSPYAGRVINVKWGEYTRKIGVDGTDIAIKEAIKSAFGLRTRRAFWLEDEDKVIRSLDRDMPLRNYTLHLDKGISIKFCIYDESDIMVVRTEDKTFYTEDDFRDFLTHRGLVGLREMNSYTCVDNLDDLHTGVVYQGVRLLGE